MTLRQPATPILTVILLTAAGAATTGDPRHQPVVIYRDSAVAAAQA